MQLHNPGQLELGLRQRLSSYSSMLWSLWLWDILHALHSNQTLNFSATEILSTEPSPAIPFQHIYRDLLQDGNEHQPILLAMNGDPDRDQSFLLLLAILSDSITVRRSIGSVINAVNPAHSLAREVNPYVLFSDHAELDRMLGQLSLALDRWDVRFTKLKRPDIKVLSLYCRLYLSCPILAALHEIALSQGEHSVPLKDLSASLNIDVSNRSVDYAWALLDTAAAVTTPLPAESSLCPAWMPICVFHAALVVWAKIRWDKSSTSAGHGSIRALLAFKVELERMQWPCCTNMAKALQKLMCG